MVKSRSRRENYTRWKEKSVSRDIEYRYYEFSNYSTPSSQQIDVIRQLEREGSAGVISNIPVKAFIKM